MRIYSILVVTICLLLFQNCGKGFQAIDREQVMGNSSVHGNAQHVDELLSRTDFFAVVSDTEGNLVTNMNAGDNYFVFVLNASGGLIECTNYIGAEIDDEDLEFSNDPCVDNEGNIILDNYDRIDTDVFSYYSDKGYWRGQMGPSYFSSLPGLEIKKYLFDIAKDEFIVISLSVEPAP